MLTDSRLGLALITAMRETRDATEKLHDSLRTIVT